MLEIKNTVVVVVLVFLKHNDLCGRLAHSNSVHEFSCTGNAVCVHVTYTVVTLLAIWEGLQYQSNFTLILN